MSRYIMTKARRAALKRMQRGNRKHRARRSKRRNPVLCGNPRRAKRRVTPRSAAARLAKWRWHHNPAASAYIPGDFLPGLRSNPRRKRRMSRAQRIACLRNLRKARAALRRR